METKIPFYNILNMFLTGIIFIIGTGIAFYTQSRHTLINKLIETIHSIPELVITVCIFAIVYESGLIINRLGSVVVESILKTCHFIQFEENYVLFNTKKNQYPIMTILSREYALSRTSLTLFGILSIIFIVVCKWWLACPSLGITVLYYLSCRKHAAKIVSLMRETSPTSTGDSSKKGKG